MKELLDKFDIGSSESRDFRYCGKQFKTTEEEIAVDVVETTHAASSLSVLSQEGQMQIRFSLMKRRS